MSNYYNEHVKLKEAMTMNLEQTIRVWNVAGLQVKEDRLPKEALVHTTFVMKLTNGNFSVGVEWKTEEDKGSYMSKVDEFKTLDELQENFPNLFDLYGNLLAIA